MKYLLDANTLITAKNDCYRFDVCPGFWTWLSKASASGQIGSIQRIKRELLDGEGDQLANWAKHNGSFFIGEDAKTSASMKIIASWAQHHATFTDAARQEFFEGADLTLVAHAHAHGCIVVTFEKGQDSKVKIKMPTVCKEFKVGCINLYQLLTDLQARFELK